jgi:hypothetical protein
VIDGAVFGKGFDGQFLSFLALVQSSDEC